MTGYLLPLLFLAPAAFAAGPAPLPDPFERLLPGNRQAVEVPALEAASLGTPRAVIIESPTGGAMAEDAVFEKLSRAAVVYAGEQHDLALHHRVQAAVLEGLHARWPGLIVGFEMLDITQQKTLDAYIAGTLSEEEFASFWNAAWGYGFELYRPILAYARENGIPCRALNAPIAIVRQAAKAGLRSLTPEQRAVIPETIAPIQDPRYLAYVRASLGGHGPMPPEVMARMLEAMQIWNETMGRSVVQASEQGPVLVIAGSGHMLYGAGIAESAASRAGLSQAVVLPYPLGPESAPLQDLLRMLRDPESGDLELGDYFWLLPRSE